MTPDPFSATEHPGPTTEHGAPDATHTMRANLSETKHLRPAGGWHTL